MYYSYSGKMDDNHTSDQLSGSNNPFFSVILPTYNRAHLLGKTIESIVVQIFQSWELIIIDDGSTDSTRQKVKAFRDTRIRYIYQQNQERSAARNTGIKSSKGQYVCFIDSDDYYLPMHLESFNKKIVSENYPEAVFYCDTFEDINGKLVRFRGPDIEAKNNIEWVVQSILGTPRTCVHHKIFEKHLFNPAIRVGEDIDLWVRIFKEYPVMYNKDCTVVFVSHKERTVDIGNETSCIEHIGLIKKIILEDKERYISETVRKKILANAWFRLAQHYDYVGRKWKSFWAYFRSLTIDPSTRLKEKVYQMIQQFFLSKMLLSLLRNQ